MNCSYRLEERQIALNGGRAVSAVLASPDKARSGAPVVVLAHGAGSDMRNPFLSAVHEGIARKGFPVVKFNFPYKEYQRRAPDPASVLEACYTRVLETIRNDPEIRRRRVVIGGKSLGGRIASHLAAAGADVAGLILLGYPLHPPRQTERLRVAHLSKIRIPMLFFCGTRDALCDLNLLQASLGRLSAPIELRVIEGADHSFNLPKSLGRSTGDVWNTIIDGCAEWLAKLP